MCSYLYGVDTTGRLVRLSTSESEWKELPYLGVDFKRLSAHAGFVWAIGGDHQVYLYVNHRDAYIRVKEDSYENQRWNPVEGFSGNLLPTDRCAFSNSDGTIQRKKDEVRLPSLAWEWEGNWEIEDNLRGTVLDSGSWTYAVDFPRSYGPKKTWNSMVRRRKWYRYRRYVAVDSWALIENVSKDPTEEPFIDIAIGGSDMPAGNADEISVWGVTVRGRVMFRKNVLETNPEGSSWIHVPSPTNLEACQISVGPTGLTWAVCWDEGRAIVRTGINRNCRMGKSWEIVEPPEGGVKLECVSVGFDCVWAVDRQKQVWFRRGINGLQAGERNEAAVGTGWLEMVGNLAMVSIGANNQAFGLGPPEDRRLFLRTGIAGSDTSGKAWSEIQALIRNRSRTESTSSLTTSISSRGHVPSLSSMRQTYSTESSPSTLRRSPTTFSRSLDSANVICTEKVRETVTKLMSASSMEEKTEDVKDSGLTSVIRQESSSESFLSANESDKSSVDGVDLSAKPVNNVVIDFVGHAEAEANDEGDGDASQSRAGASLDPLEPQMSSLSLEASSIMSTSKNSLLPMGDDFHFDSYEMGVPELEGRLVLTSISAGDCRIDPHNLPPWFSNLQRNASNESDEPWKAEIVENLERRRERETRDFKHFNEAVDRKSWVKTTKGFCLREPSTWLRASIELETSGSSQRLIDGGLLTVYPSNEKAIRVALTDITCVLHMYNPAKPALCIHTTMRTWKKKPLKIGFESETVLEDWISNIGIAHWQVQNLSGPASPDALWSTTTRGDIFIHESQAAANSLQSDRKKLVDMRWRQMGGSLLKVECCPAGIAWGIGWDYGAWVYSGGFGGGPWESLYSEKTKPQSDTRCFYVYENQRWNPVTGYNSTLLPTDRPQWSDYSGRIAVSKSSMKPPSGKWQWTGEWQIDFTTPGGVDGNGWQYALDFPSSYHPTKGFTDYVRRRRWFRKCKNSTTGPWLYVGSTRLVDITLQLDPQPEGFVGVWAVAANGDILMREEVSPEQPLGNGWKHVPCDEPVVSISFGRYGKVWAVAKNGSVYLRHGITQSCPEGELWLHLECPSETKLVQISAGSSEVWVVDEAHRLYRRKDVMPTMFPEGVSWEYVCDNIRQVSVDAKDEIWAIAEKANLAGSTYNGVVCQRSGRTTTSLAGSGWDYGIGGGWQYICVRGAPVKST